MRRVAQTACAAVVAAMATIGAAPLSARQQDSAVPQQASATPGAEPYDVRDLVRHLFSRTPPATAERGAWDSRKPMLAALPSVGYKPSTGVTIGAAGNVAAYFGDPGNTRISSALLSISVSRKRQAFLSAKFSVSAPHDRLRVEADNRFQWTSENTYGLGSRVDVADALNAKFNFVRLYETALFRLRGGVYAGVGVLFSSHARIRPGHDADDRWDTSPFAEYSRQHGFALDSQRSSGTSLNLRVDTRDSQINASRGWLASVWYRPYFKRVLGSASAWQEVLLDLRTYVNVRNDGRERLAFWVYGDMVAGGVAPYFDLPALGMDTYGRSGRGYTAGRFRGERLMYGEVEYRATLTGNGLLGMVAFANATTIANRQGRERLFDAFEPAAGVGLRVLFNKRSKTNLCLDYAWGRGSTGMYFGIQEAF